MEPCQPHFVRCIKPNRHAAPAMYDQEYVLTQLRYTGMLETTRVRREGYAYRPTFEDFIQQFRFVAFSFTEKVKVGVGQQCV